MPLRELTTIVPADEEVEITVLSGNDVADTTERKLYTITELKALDGSDEIDSRAFENALEKLAQHTYMDDWYLNQTLNGDDEGRGLLAACGITVPPKTEQVDVKVNGKFQYDENGKPIKKWVTREQDIWDSYNAYEAEFGLSKHATVDERKFLNALQWYLSGKDIRTLPELQWGIPEGSKRGLAATGAQIRKLDLRSKDARIIREQGLTFANPYGWRGSINEFDFDYHYEGLSEQFEKDANELLSDLLHEVGFMLRDEAEYRVSEEALMADAQANEMYFDRNGRIA